MPKLPILLALIDLQYTEDLIPTLAQTVNDYNILGYIMMNVFLLLFITILILVSTSLIPFIELIADPALLRVHK